MTPLALIPEKASPSVGWELIDEPSDHAIPCPDCSGEGEVSYDVDRYDRARTLHWTEAEDGECQSCDGRGTVSPRFICRDFTPADFDLRVDNQGDVWRKIK